jgi:hypothetical protein
MNRIYACTAACAALFGLGSAQAAEIRVGVLGMDVVSIDGGVNGKEESAGLSLGYVSDRFSDSGWIPRLEIGGDLNLGGKTNLAYAGGLWRGYFGGADQFYIEGSFGLAVHDGKDEVPDLEPGLTPEEAQRRIFGNAHYIEFGSTVLFREAVSVGYRFSDTMAADIYMEHFSHGTLLSDGSNEGLDVFGVRLAYTLN